jgi:ABC-type bacteriocin/lantibiotic exporter with double-glycine peptidase domain
MKKLIIPAALLAALAFSGCAGRYSPHADFSKFDVSLPVPFHAQADESYCGLASAEMAVDFYGKTLDAGYVALLKKEAKLTGGIQAASLKACLEASGFDAAVFPGTLDRELQGLYRQLDLKRPLIVLISEKPGATGHYMVLSGYSGQALLAVLNPVSGPSAARVEWFVPLWKNSGSLVLLALPR